MAHLPAFALVRLPEHAYHPFRVKPIVKLCEGRQVAVGTALAEGWRSSRGRYWMRRAFGETSAATGRWHAALAFDIDSDTYGLADVRWCTLAQEHAYPVGMLFLFSLFECRPATFDLRSTWQDSRHGDMPVGDGNAGCGRVGWMVLFFLLRPALMADGRLCMLWTVGAGYRCGPCFLPSPPPGARSARNWHTCRPSLRYACKSICTAHFSKNMMRRSTSLRWCRAASAAWRSRWRMIGYAALSKRLPPLRAACPGCADSCADGLGGVRGCSLMCTSRIRFRKRMPICLAAPVFFFA